MQRRVFRISILALLLSMILPCQANAQGKKIVSGKVLDSTDLVPIPGVVIGVVSSEKPGTYVSTAMSDSDGNWSISCLPSDVLEASCLGYVKLTEKVGNRTKIDLKLQSDVTQLEETVVIGYGSVKKQDLTGSVVNVKMGDVRDTPVSSIDEALQGRIAGADIMTTSGEPGATTSIRIRGTRSISASNEPLIVVDGVMDAVHDLNDINSADIESISVLKDASSTAIYGARGSNGVILVTTKASVSNKVSKPTITFKAEGGVSALPRKLDIMNGTEFAIYRNMLNLNRSDDKDYHTPVSGQETSDPFSYGEGTDWTDEMVRVAPYQNYFASMYGGLGKGSYYFSLGYNDNEGIIKKSGDKKTTATVSINYNVLKWLKLGYKINFSQNHTDATLASIGGTNWWSAATYLSPLIKPGDNYNPLWNLGGTINTPASLIALNTDYADRLAYRQTVTADVTVSDWLKWNNSISYYTYQRHTYQFQPSTLPAKVDGEGAFAYRSEGSQVSYNMESTLTATKDWGKKYHLDATVGLTYYNYGTNEFSLYGSGYLIDASLWNNMGAIPDKELYSGATSYLNKTTASALGRVNFNYRQRYYLTVSGRYDGASNFAQNNKWGFFPSAAFKWNIANERFMRRSHNVDELSLKLSVGKTGNDAISSYASLAALTYTTSGYLFNNSQPVAIYPSRLPSPDLTWETTVLCNAALTGAFYNNRFNFTLEAYHSRTNDLLLSVKSADFTGYSSHYANLGETTNDGFELSLESRNIVKGDFSWTTNFTISHNKQKVVDIGNEDYVSVYNSPGNNPFMMYGYKSGYPLNALWGFQYAGVWHNDEEIERNKSTHAYVSQTSQQKSGLPRYIDVNHDGTLNSDDLCYLGNADPYIYGGLQNTFTYKNFKLGVYFTYSLGGKIYNYLELYMAGGRLTNQYRYMFDAWSPSNPDSDIPAAGYSYDSLVPSSFMVHDASYLRLHTLSLGYTLKPKTKLIRDVTFGLSGSNLFLWKNYNGYDPDVSTSSGSSTIRRMDLGAYPRARRVVFSVQVRY